MKRIKLMRIRLVEYAAQKRNGVLTVFVMLSDICCGKLHYGGILILLEGALEREFYFNIIILAGIHGRHGIWNCISNSTRGIPRKIMVMLMPRRESVWRKGSVSP
jgi:hypothetical protein